MGPVIIFDKSMLESLTPDEAMWLDNFYLCNITPVFFIETLADIEKQVRSGRTPEDVVGSLAYKTPDYSSKANAHHRSLMYGELTGAGAIDIVSGRPHVSGGKRVELDGKTGVLFNPSPEEEALLRWTNHEFMDLERLIAKKWRAALIDLDLEASYRYFQSFFKLAKPKTLADVKKLADSYIYGLAQEEVLTFGLTLIGAAPQAQGEVLRRWCAKGKPPVREFAPYFTHVFSVDFFFNLAIAADLIGRGRPSHKIDLAYLYYLPFCMVFTSNDKLHANVVPLFLRDDQTFVPGTELKTDLGKLDEHYDALPGNVRQTGVISFAFYPPKDDSFLTTRLWDKYMSPGWREHDFRSSPQPDSKLVAKINEEMKRLEEGPPMPDDRPTKPGDPDSMIVRRMVLGRKGKWSRFPPEVMHRRRNER